MVFVLAAAVIFTVWRFALASRQRGFIWAVRELVLAAGSGLLAGILVGLGARIGMSAITVANGDLPRFTVSGTAAVVMTFAGFGGVFGVIYAGFFRQFLRHRGLIFGLLITLVSWYPLAQAAVQQLRFSPSLIPLIIATGLCVALMWLPFGVVLEKIVSRWQHPSDHPAQVNPAT